MGKKGLLPGTFNPPTLGHFNIIQRASQICDMLYVAVAFNPEKDKGLFNLSERRAMLQDITKGLDNVEIVSFTGLVVDYASEHSVDYIVRGLRAFSSYEREFQMAQSNRKMSGIDTLFLLADQQYSHISSTLIFDIGRNGRRLHGFVPDEIEGIVFERIAGELQG